MTPVWEPSCEKHGVSREEIIYVLLNAPYVSNTNEVPKRGRIMVFIGPPHPQTDREIEVLVHEFPETDQQARVFHAMQLGPKFRKFREENPHGWQ